MFHNFFKYSPLKKGTETKSVKKRKKLHGSRFSELSNQFVKQKINQLNFLKFKKKSIKIYRKNFKKSA